MALTQMLNMADIHKGAWYRLVWTGDRGVPRDLNGALCQVGGLGRTRVKVFVRGDGASSADHERWVGLHQLAKPFANQRGD